MREARAFRELLQGMHGSSAALQHKVQTFVTGHEME
jgi:hypothetical protein